MVSNAREEILLSIRKHLAASSGFDAKQMVGHAIQNETPSLEVKQNSESLVELFAESLEAVDGHCVVVDSQPGTVEAISKILSDLRSTRLSPRRIAVSDSD